MNAQSPSFQVIQAVAQQTGAAATELPPLYDTLDPEGLDRLADADATITFEYARCRVTVRGGDAPDVAVQSGPGAADAERSSYGSAGATD